MGCITSNGNKKLEDMKQGFMIRIQHPDNKTEKQYKYFDEKQKSDLIMNVMNGICFSEKVSDKCDGNFISLYDPTDDRFHYYIQKLDGIEIDNPNEPLKGKIWIPYINEKRHDWDTLVENNIRISITDHLLWKLEYLKK
ncbi:unnamed protein product [Paramecium primaurelia]|uniref:Uncharacterized protein n=1 Tax=Paramecium primaurelia TaxID=5886 RepID=A0A8S1MPP1_PARPR|nr:unnamed protein product [Paramecium primaurelia]